jgi:nitrate reductase cytochrome c-type subunit
MSQRYYCKWCGASQSTVSALTSGGCSRNPTKGGHHELYEGSEKTRYTCKYCGASQGTISALVSSSCNRHPNKGHHEPAL